MQVQGANTATACHQFDPDTASAYLEQALPQRALTTYEEHLATCVSCSRHIIELSRLMPVQATMTEPVVVRSSFQERLSEWLAGWRWGALAGLGAVAATVLLVAVIVNRSKLESASPMVTVKQSEAQQSEPQATPLPEPSAANMQPAQSNRESKAMPLASPATNAPLMDSQGSAKPIPAAPPTTQPSLVDGVSSAAPPPPVPIPTPTKAEAERAAAAGSAVAQNQIQNLRGQTPSGPEVNQVQTERVLERAKKDNQTAQQSADAVAPASAKPAPKAPEKPPERVIEKRSREMEEDAEKRQTKTKEAMKPASISAARSRVVGSKTFSLENGTWVDNAYGASKDLPLVRLTQDGEAYKQTLKDLPSLKAYFDLKPVIVVWQGKVYRVEKK